MAICFMVKKYYRVINEFDTKKDYGIKIRKQYANCLASFRKGDKINPEEFITEHLNEFTLHKVSVKSNQALVYHAISSGLRMGILEPVSQEELGIAISYDEFCKLETVAYFIEQLRGSQYRNVDPKKSAGTANCYAYLLWHFNNWLHGRSFEFYKEVAQGNNTYKREKTKVTINTVEQFLKMYQEPFKVESDYVKVVKKYLLDAIHENKRASSIKIDRCAIRSYFEKNDSPLNFKFNFGAKYRTNHDESEQSSLTLDELMELLTVGKPSITQKAVFLCKFHRGLDSSTLVDRFNFSAWEQLVKYFGTSDYHTWNLSLCPVPIKLTRMKTDFTHTGFLDRDAIIAVQNYLDYRKKKTGKEMENGDALFLNEHRKPITNSWVNNISMKRLAQNASLDKQLEGYKAVRYKINTHEFRDLLKSTLLDCGVRPDLADHFIGHKPKDSYEKQTILYPKTLQSEYSKASKRINIFSNFANMVKGVEDIDDMHEKMDKMELELKKIKKRKNRTDGLKLQLISSA